MFFLQFCAGRTYPPELALPVASQDAHASLHPETGFEDGSEAAAFGRDPAAGEAEMATKERRLHMHDTTGWADGRLSAMVLMKVQGR